MQRKGPLRERMKRKSCHGSPPGNAPWHNLATTGPPRKRTTAKYRHSRQPENASRRDLATVGRWGTHSASILPSASAPGGVHHGEILPRQPPSRILLDDILPRRPSAARTCCEIAVASGSRKTSPEQSVCQFNNARRHVQETMKIFWCLSPRNGTENVLA